jgi:hypothetical protein
MKSSLFKKSILRSKETSIRTTLFERHKKKIKLIKNSRLNRNKKTIKNLNDIIFVFKLINSIILLLIFLSIIFCVLIIYLKYSETSSIQIPTNFRELLKFPVTILNYIQLQHTELPDIPFALWHQVKRKLFLQFEILLFFISIFYNYLKKKKLDDVLLLYILFIAISSYINLKYLT